MREPIKRSILPTLLLLSSAAMSAGTAPEYDDGAPDKDYMWVDGYEDMEGDVVKGFYRERSRDGFAWIDGDYVDEDWVDPHWEPTTIKPDHVWVHGHVGSDDYWVPGHWRIIARVGYVWEKPAVVHGVWLHGHWRPIKSRVGSVWVPGHRGLTGAWVSGHWRAGQRTDFRWNAGRWRYGIWVSAHWRPLKVREDHVWVAGYLGPDGWIAGLWRPKLRVGFTWRAGYWGPRGWIVGSWRKGPRVVVKRRYPRVHHTHHMHVSRAGFRRHVKHRKKHRRRGG